MENNKCKKSNSHTRTPKKNPPYLLLYAPSHSCILVQAWVTSSSEVYEMMQPKKKEKNNKIKEIKSDCCDW